MERHELIAKVLENPDYPTYVAKQLNHNIYKLGKIMFSEISNVKRDIVTELESEWGNINSLKLLEKQKDEQVEKYLFQTRDANQVEAVKMSYKANSLRSYGHEALCMSTQIGCAMGCKFCATGAIGLKRHMTATEIVDQYLYFTQNKLKIDSIFFSGMGEPLANSSFFDALEILTSKEMIGLSQRRISVSTVGVIPGIKIMTERFPQVNIAYSLHTPFHDQRLELVPAEKAYPLKEVMSALRTHVEKTNRKVFIAYIMLGDVNDSIEHARELVKIIRKQGEKSYLFHVNLIKYHQTNAQDTFKPSSTMSLERFKSQLETAHINTTVRQDFGQDIDAACGQLSARYEKRKSFHK